MDDTTEFVLPDFLGGQDVGSIHAEMLAQIPDEFDKSEGGFIWDMTYPTAMEKAQAAQYLIPEALKCMFPMWAYGEILDMHGANRGLKRKDAQYASCEVTFSGTDGTRIPKGTTVSTASGGEDSAVTFKTSAEGVISNGRACVAAVALVPGGIGNVASGSICRIDMAISGVTAVTNAQAAFGGVDEESDTLFRKRIIEFDSAQGQNYVGSMADYRRWALEVSGVGGAKVISASDSSGLVKLIITDDGGSSASTTLCQRVYDHIMRPDSPENRLAPINAALSVVTPEKFNITISATVQTSGGTLAQIKAAFATAVSAYFGTIDDGIVRLSRVGALLSKVEGVSDYSELKMNSAAANITLTEMQLPYTEESMVTISDA